MENQREMGRKKKRIPPCLLCPRMALSPLPHTHHQPTPPNIHPQRGGFTLSGTNTTNTRRLSSHGPPPPQPQQNTILFPCLFSPPLPSGRLEEGSHVCGAGGRRGGGARERERERERCLFICGCFLGCQDKEGNTEPV